MSRDLLPKIAGFSMLVFCPLLLIGFLLHPDVLSFELTDTPQALIANFHHQPAFHFGHLLAFLAVPFIIVAVAFLMTLPVTQGAWWLFDPARARLAVHVAGIERREGTMVAGA